jgi:hypothetical protein
MNSNAYRVNYKIIHTKAGNKRIVFRLQNDYEVKHTGMNIVRNEELKGLDYYKPFRKTKVNKTKKELEDLVEKYQKTLFLNIETLHTAIWCVEFGTENTIQLILNLAAIDELKEATAEHFFMKSFSQFIYDLERLHYAQYLLSLHQESKIAMQGV